jgi:outer membrane protein
MLTLYRENIMRKTLLAVALLGFANGASADALGLFVGAGAWSHDASGGFSSTDAGSDVIDMSADLGMSEESEVYMWAAFEHFIPIVPNIRLESTPLKHTGTSTASLDFQGATVPAGQASTVDLSSTDMILYYRVLDNWVSLDLGVDLRKVDGEFTVGAESQTFSETVPMLYVAAQFDLPLTGLSIGGDIKTISNSGDEYTDWSLKALYEIGIVGFELGMRTVTVTLEDADNINADMDFEGMTAGMYLHF